ncbi:MAG: hypothetical protein F4X14_10615 [Caldilineaceae bacterium SB0661_bin_32]|uniref:Uncharacterized protein n=1 Tax=Caldilineaceae bacterium SB0661_bin_32 TaxID=2605255 RepID=A0A6B1D766_9CHLR|nr:hypothetical protein [Caldilineaceae bacterium SB0661_bin_32]
MNVTAAPRYLILLLTLFTALFSYEAVLAHQPFFEDTDSTAGTPMPVSDPEISTALFSTLERPGDVDFFTFSVSARQTVEIGMTIPQIEGQDQFAPYIGVIASGLEGDTNPGLPADARALVSGQEGAIVLEAADATIFFEPFSRTAYWQRQRRRITFPVQGEVKVVVWHPQGSAGRYALVVGQREVSGGDPAFARKLKEYWTPVILQPSAESDSPDTALTDPTQEPQPSLSDSAGAGQSAPRCSWLTRLLAFLFGESELCQ